MAANPVNWFEIPVNDINRAKAFYERVLDIQLTVQEMGPRVMAFFPSQMEAYGTSGALVKEETYIPSHAGTMIYFSVADIEAILALAAESGGRVLVPKESIGQHGFVGYFEDSEGNRLGLHSMA